MWWLSSCGSPSSETRSMHLCRSQLRLSGAPEERRFCAFVSFKSTFSAPLQHSVPCDPPPQQADCGCWRSSSSMVSDTELMSAGGFSRALLMPSTTALSYLESRSRSSITGGGTGLSGCLVWYQKYRPLWQTDAQRVGGHIKLQEK